MNITIIMSIPTQLIKTQHQHIIFYNNFLTSYKNNKNLNFKYSMIFKQTITTTTQILDNINTTINTYHLIKESHKLNNKISLLLFKMKSKIRIKRKNKIKLMISQEVCINIGMKRMTKMINIIILKFDYIDR